MLHAIVHCMDASFGMCDVHQWSWVLVGHKVVGTMDATKTLFFRNATSDETRHDRGRGNLSREKGGGECAGEQEVALNKGLVADRFGCVTHCAYSQTPEHHPGCDPGCDGEDMIAKRRTMLGG